MGDTPSTPSSSSKSGNWFATHKKQAAIGGVAGVALLALMSRKKSSSGSSGGLLSSILPGTTSGAASVPVATSSAPAGYDSSTLDAYNSLSDSINQLQNQVSGLEASQASANQPPSSGTSGLPAPGSSSSSSSTSTTQASSSSSGSGSTSPSPAPTPVTDPSTGVTTTAAAPGTLAQGQGAPISGTSNVSDQQFNGYNYETFNASGLTAQQEADAIYPGTDPANAWATFHAHNPGVTNPGDMLNGNAIVIPSSPNAPLLPGQK